MSASPKRLYNVHVYENTLYVRAFEATSEEDAIAQAKELYDAHGPSPFENFGTEVYRWESEPAE